MWNKSSKAMILAAALTASAVIPAVVAPVATQAATLSISDFVIQKNGNLYSLVIGDYQGMKAGGVDFLKDAPVKYVQMGDGTTFSLNDYKDAKAAVPGGTMGAALDVLQDAGAAVKNVSIGKVVIDNNGNITLQDPGETGSGDDLEVIGIE
ncbi:hypothetical protein [Bacillus sp. FJAT-42315]|uniref:hypothetical protein n=1 Tax=Bacillus sp. FJAT-42315 TaxID=2014077 RepID=UPI000BA91990|nr:hypothetical protein [Bacillus sp. FJAT-42315]PAQ13260.1 hypothetical protein CD798_16015 [Bacillaceae bacterium SAOS 7]